MDFTSSRRVKIALVAAAGYVFLLLPALLISYRRDVGRVQVRIADWSRTSNGAIKVTVVLANSSSRTFNVVDDDGGRPAFILDSGGEYGVGLSDTVNQLKINLAPGASLTNIVLVTNPLPRFRLRVVLRDLAAERRVWSVYKFLPQNLAGKVVKLRRREWEPKSPTSDWLEPSSRLWEGPNRSTE